MEPLSVGDLAKRLGGTPSTTSELVSDLSRAGVTERHADPANRRRVLVSLAPEYCRPFQAFVALRSAALWRALDRLSPRDQAGFVAGLAAWPREVLAEEQ
ncbi:MarR family winged helix-turn-helix transcriptional regulator [Fodinicola feengrottensis]|uniref:MarR family winged helix-turn-helix transcriptional regulator n=1 Tax=Fodinicola feengrottensis TaxID=435914 RepID=UPI003CD08E7B